MTQHVVRRRQRASNLLPHQKLQKLDHDLLRGLALPSINTGSVRGVSVLVRSAGVLLLFVILVTLVAIRLVAVVRACIAVAALPLKAALTLPAPPAV